MNYSEFRTMTTSLERYYKDVKLAMILGHKDKELDMRYVDKIHILLKIVVSAIYHFSLQWK